VRDRWVLEETDDMDQGVGAAQRPEVLRSWSLVLAEAGPGKVEIADFGVGYALRCEKLAEPVQAFIGDLDGPEVRLEAGVTAGLGVAPGEGVEDSGLARALEADDGEVHDLKMGHTPEALKPPALLHAWHDVGGDQLEDLEVVLVVVLQHHALDTGRGKAL
jgi:hypothetical protein